MHLKNKLTLYALVFFFLSGYGCKKIEPNPQTPPSPPKMRDHKDHPNIIFILGDDDGYEIPTADGGQSYYTPNIDLMAAHGMRFNGCFASPLCSPSRFMLVTGQYNFRNYTDWGIMDPDQKTFANMLHDDGYTTMVTGKWQFDGGDEAIHNFGYDKYCVYMPFHFCPESLSGNRYKDPTVYENANYLPPDSTEGKYGEDIYTDYLLNFIDSNKNKPFFIYYPMVLTHEKFSPTPDDPEFASWDPSNKSDPKYFPSMVKYMDKKIGLILEQLKIDRIDSNTVIFFSGDNGTPKGVKSGDGDTIVNGEKGYTTTYGTHVPLIVSWPGQIQPETINNDLIDFTDFLPTFAGIANIPVPTNYGKLDGVSFYPAMVAQSGTPRSWTYDYFKPNICYRDFPAIIFVQNATYKLYSNGKFYNIATDILEKHPIPDSLLTSEEQEIKQQFQTVLDNEHN